MLEINGLDGTCLFYWYFWRMTWREENLRHTVPLLEFSAVVAGLFKAGDQVDHLEGYRRRGQRGDFGMIVSRRHFDNVGADQV